jgi:hypothetical protein
VLLRLDERGKNSMEPHLGLIIAICGAGIMFGIVVMSLVLWTKAENRGNRSYYRERDSQLKEILRVQKKLEKLLKRNQ